MINTEVSFNKNFQKEVLSVRVHSYHAGAAAADAKRSLAQDYRCRIRPGTARCTSGTGAALASSAEAVI